MNYYRTLKEKGYGAPFIYNVREKFKAKFNLWDWASIDPIQMKEVEEYVNGLPKNNENN